MSTRNKWAMAVLGGVLAAWAQDAPAPASSLKVNFPADSPVGLVSAGWGESRTDARGGALVLDLHTSLTLRNSSQRRIRGITLLVQAQEVTPGGKGSVAVPSLDVRPGETFPIRVDLRLLRPLLAGGGPLAEVSLDGVLFDDLSFYGPDRLNSRRSMTVWELEARRDRRHFKSVLEARGPAGLREAMVDSIDRLAERPRLDVQVIRRGRATAVAAQERQCNFAFLQIPDSPLEPVSGMARVAGGEARAPRIEVRNRSDRPVRYFEIGWIIRDRDGREFLAGSVPAADSGLTLAPGAKGAGGRGRIVEVYAAGRAAGGDRRHDGLRQRGGILRRNDVDSGAHRARRPAAAVGAGAFGRGAAPGRSVSPPRPDRAGERTEEVLTKLLQFPVMMFQSRFDPAKAVGRAPERLKLEERSRWRAGSRRSRSIRRRRRRCAASRRSGRRRRTASASLRPAAWTRAGTRSRVSSRLFKALW